MRFRWVWVIPKFENFRSYDSSWQRRGKTVCQTKCYASVSNWTNKKKDSLYFSSTIAQLHLFSLSPSKTKQCGYRIIKSIAVLSLTAPPTHYNIEESRAGRICHLSSNDASGYLIWPPPPRRRLLSAERMTRANSRVNQRPAVIQLSVYLSPPR